MIQDPNRTSTSWQLSSFRSQAFVVIDYTHFLAGPYLTRCLAALGAEVIKIERPTAGDAGRDHPYFIQGQSGYFLQQNMGKEGVCINIEDPRRARDDAQAGALGRRLRRELSPGRAREVGARLRETGRADPGLVYCSISAYGHTGPDSHRPGFGLIAEAKSGIMAMVGEPGEAPPLLRVALGDLYTGIHGVAAVCAALLGRVKSGRGQHIDMALYDTLMSMHEYAVQCYTLSGGKEIPQQTGHDLPTSTLYGVFTAKDGDHLVIAAQVNDAWRRFAALVAGQTGNAAFAADARFHTAAGRNELRLEILPVVRAWVAGMSAAECLAALDAADVPCAKVQRIDEVLADPQIQARGMLIEQDHPVLGKVRLPNLPFRFSECDTTQTTPAPLMGQHNRKLAAELGYTPEQIEAMVRDGVLHAEKAVAALGLG